MKYKITYKITIDAEREDTQDPIMWDNADKEVEELIDRPDIVNTGVVDSIEPCRFGDYLVYNCYPIKKGGTVAKIGLFYNNERSKVEKI